MNDSDCLLERLICVLPKVHSQPWHDMEDAYGSSLWDIYPTCQVAGVGFDDTVIIDGAFGTTVRWKSFHQIWTSRRTSWKRWLAWKALHFSGWFFIIGCILIGTGDSANRAGSNYKRSSAYSSSYPSSGSSYRNSSSSGAGNQNISIGVILMLAGVTLWLMAPRLLKTILGGKFWDSQAATFGIEGYLNIATIERSIFGGDFNRLTWSPNGSPLSRHQKNEFGECIGIDPTEDIEVRKLVERSKRAQPGEQRVRQITLSCGHNYTNLKEIFMIVDTYSMQVTLFQATRPPIAIVICGSEGGMQRAIACSYDWTTQTLFRETVLRMPTTVLNRMGRVSKFKIGLKRHNTPVIPRQFKK
jgi:hypothetical protein